MEPYEQIIAEITDKIKANGNKEITGAILQGVLLGIIAAVQANQQGKLEYYHEDIANGFVRITGEFLSYLRAALPEGMTVDTSNFKFLFEDSGLEIRDNSGLRQLIFGSEGMETNINIKTSQSLTLGGAIFMNDPNGNKYMLYIDNEGKLIVEPYEE